MNQKSFQLIEILQRISLFKGLDKERLISLIKLFKPESHNGNTVLFYQGFVSDNLYILTNGKLNVIVNNTKVATIDTVTCLGEIGVFLKKRRSATIQLVVKSDFLVLPFSQLETLMNKSIKLNNILSNNIARMIAEKINSNNHSYLKLLDENNRLKKTVETLFSLNPIEKSTMEKGNKVDLKVLSELKDFKENFRAFLTIFGVSSSPVVKKISSNKMLCDQSGLYELNEQDNFKGLIFISKSRPLKFSAIILKIIKTSILFQYKLDDPNQQPVIDNSIS